MDAVLMPGMPATAGNGVHTAAFAGRGAEATGGDRTVVDFLMALTDALAPQDSDADPATGVTPAPATTGAAPAPAVVGSGDGAAAESASSPDAALEALVRRLLTPASEASREPRFADTSAPAAPPAPAATREPRFADSPAPAGLPTAAAPGEPRFAEQPADPAALAFPRELRFAEKAADQAVRTSADPVAPIAPRELEFAGEGTDPVARAVPRELRFAWGGSITGELGVAETAPEGGVAVNSREPGFARAVQRAVRGAGEAGPEAGVTAAAGHLAHPAAVAAASALVSRSSGMPRFASVPAEQGLARTHSAVEAASLLGVRSPAIRAGSEPSSEGLASARMTGADATAELLAGAAERTIQRAAKDDTSGTDTGSTASAGTGSAVSARIADDPAGVRAAHAHSATATGSPALVDTGRPAAAAPVPSLNMAGTERVERIRQHAVYRPVQRLTVELDDARVAVSVRGDKVSVDVVSDPASALGGGWAKGVERSIERAIDAAVPGASSSMGSLRAERTEQVGDPAGVRPGQGREVLLPAGRSGDAAPGRGDESARHGHHGSQGRHGDGGQADGRPGQRGGRPTRNWFPLEEDA